MKTIKPTIKIPVETLQEVMDKSFYDGKNDVPEDDYKKDRDSLLNNIKGFLKKKEKTE